MFSRHSLGPNGPKSFKENIFKNSPEKKSVEHFWLHIQIWKSKLYFAVLYICHTLPSGRLNPLSRGTVFVLLFVFSIMFCLFILLIISFIILVISSSLLFLMTSWSVSPLIFSFRSDILTPFWYMVLSYESNYTFFQQMFINQRSICEGH